LEVLGHVVRKGFMEVPDKALAAVGELEAPKSVKEVQRFLGLVGYFRRFIVNFAAIAVPLTDLTKTGTGGSCGWAWGEPQQAAFELLRARLLQKPVLRMAVRQGGIGYTPFVLETDASDIAVGAVLLQRGEDGHMHPCAYLSRQLQKAERNYTVSERECLAVIFAIGKWRAYIADGPFTVVSDHGALAFLMTQPNLTGRLARWALTLQQYTFKIVHRPGKENAAADALSRLRTVTAAATEGLTTQEDRKLMAEQLRHVSEPTVPQEGDGQSIGGRERPAMTQSRSNASVLIVTRGMAAKTQRTTGGEEQRATSTEKVKSDPSTLVNRWPTKLVWHAEVWMSTATQAALREGAAATALLPSKFRNKVTEDMRKYRAVFNEAGEMPISIAIRRNNTWLEVPPPSARVQMIEQAHRLGHFSALKTAQRIENEGAWWQGLHADAEAMVQRCTACQRDAAHRVYFHAAQSIPIPEGVWDRVHMDLLELPQAKTGERYVMLLVDALSKFPVAYTLANKEAVTVAKALWAAITVFGPMICLHSDNGPEFVNGVVDALVQLHGIQRQLITAYRPQANGLVERMNRVVLQVLRKVCGNTPEEWPTWLDAVMLAIRTATSAATGYSPFALFFGRQYHPLENYMILQLDVERLDGNAEARLVNRVIVTKRVLEDEWRAEARKRAEAAGKRQREGTDRELEGKVVEKRLESGTRVYVKKRVLGHKLAHRFEGPFYIMSDAPSTGEEKRQHYLLGDEYGGRLEGTFPRDFVFEVPQDEVQLSQRQKELYIEGEWEKAIGEVALGRPGPILEGGDEEDQKWAIAKICDIRRDKGGKELVLVEWEGYGTEERQWIEETEIDTEDMIALKRRWLKAERVKKKRGAKESE